MQQWERLDRTVLVDTSFLKVYSDKIRLPDGSMIDDYTLIKKRDIVIVIATDEQNRLVAFMEYKYAVNKMLLTLPAGQIDSDESPEQAAQRELLEETGYTGDDFKVVNILNEYPTKDLHTITVVRVQDVRLEKPVQHEVTEIIRDIQLLTLDEVKKRIQNGDWTTTSALAALTIGLPELFR